MTPVLLWVLRGLSFVQTAGMVAMPVLIGSFLEGNYRALASHARVGGPLIGLTFLVFLTATALALLPPGRMPWWPAALLFVMTGLIPLQMGWGYGRVTTLHVPSGVFLVAASVIVCGWAWTPGRVRRSARYRPGTGTGTGTRQAQAQVSA